MSASDSAGLVSARPQGADPARPRAPSSPSTSLALRANWARLNQASGRAECAGVIKADAYGLGLAPIAKRAHQRGLQDLLRGQRRRRPGRARGAARRHHLRARRPAARRRGALCGLRPAPRALAACPRCATGPPTAARADAGSRPASTSTPGINRLGMPEREVEQLAAAPELLRRLRDDAGDEPPRLRRPPRRSHERAPARALRGAARQAAAGAGEPCQLRRHCSWARAIISTWCGPASRFTAAARTRASPTPCRRWCGSPPASCRCARSAPGASIGYGATYKVHDARAHRHHRRGLCRRLPARPERGDRRGGPCRLRRRLSRADRRPRVHGFHHRRRDERAARSWRGAAPGWR